MQGESREDLSQCDPGHGGYSLERRCSDSVLESWYANVFPVFIERCRDLIVEQTRPGNVEGLILSGSFASCEGCVVMLGGGPVFLSDIDLLLIVSSPASHAALYSRRSIIGKACEDLLPDARFEGRIDVGIMTSGELAAMPLSPGVFDMRERGVLLCGGKGLLGRFPSFGPDEIAAGEALRLLENRMAAFLGGRPVTDRPEGGDLYRFLYGVSRVYTDIVTASLCAGGMYRSGYEARAELLARSPGASEVRRELGGSLTEKAMRWTGFKTDPVMEGVWTGEDRAWHMWLEAAGDLLAVRDGISRKDHGSARAGSPRFTDLFRAWNAAVPDISILERMKLFIGSLFSGREPGGHVRGESLRLIRHVVEKGTGGIVGAAPGGYPHGRTSWEEAASRTSAEWHRLVTGREEETLG